MPVTKNRIAGIAAGANPSDRWDAYRHTPRRARSDAAAMGAVATRF
jgi:hypothetical protein